MMLVSRRSRMRRTPTGKSLALTDRDLAIFRALSGYRYLRSNYLHAFAGGASETRFKERLGDLFHEGFIERPVKQWEFAGARHQPAVYELGAKAQRILAEQGGVIPARSWLSGESHRQFAHARMICECLASIELAARASDGLRFIPWGEILARAPAQTRLSALPHRLPLADGAVIPDGAFGLEYRTGEMSAYRFFALEADRGTMPFDRSDPKQSSYRGKLAGYREAIANYCAKTHWGVSTLLVLTVTLGAERLKAMVSASRENAGDAQFLFKAVDASALVKPAPDLLSAPWERAHFSPLSINVSA